MKRLKASNGNVRQESMTLKSSRAVLDRSGSFPPCSEFGVAPELRFEKYMVRHSELDHTYHE